MLARKLSVLAFWPLMSCGFNMFTVEDDIELGRQVRDEIASNPQDYPILSAEDHPEAYDHLYRMRDEVIATGILEHGELFDWEMYIIDDSEVLNAFAAPGGYIYFYTGLIEFLDHEDDFMGVLGHEMAHSDRRHSTQQLTRAYGVGTLLGVALGEDPGLLAEIAAAIAQGADQLRFSRRHEAEADAYSVEYLCQTDYASDGTAGFFEKLVDEGGMQVPEFLSTHPSSENRVEDIRAYADELGCSTERNPDAQWQAFLDSLP